MTTSTSDVVIVGGGIVGAATAYYLACRGIASTVVERDRVAAHASGFSYAALGTFDEAGMDGAHFDVASEGMRLHRELADLLPAETGTQTDFRDRPQLWLAFTDEEIEEARNPTGWDKRKQQWEVEDQGQRVRIVDADEARRIEPRITPSAIGAVYTEGTADVNAHRLTVALAAAAESAGPRYAPAPWSTSSAAEAESPASSWKAAASTAARSSWRWARGASRPRTGWASRFG